MYYYEVLVADNSFKGAGALTYSYGQELSRGRIVQAPVKNRQVLGVVSKPVRKPAFITKAVLATVIDAPLPEQLISLAEWMPRYYPASTGETMQQFLPGRLYPPDTTSVKAGLPQLPSFGLPALTSEQQAVLMAIVGPAKLAEPDTCLLHGETGSGKTRVYVELALLQFQAGRSSIILTPEIGLTPQLTQTFTRTFGVENVVTTHSQLTPKQRSLQWNRVLHGPQPLVVLGPRSALFMPLRNIGLIVLDEFHEASYKQDQAPHYHASKVAAKLAELHRAILILGSATPPVADYYVAVAKSKQILRMTAVAAASSSAKSADLADTAGAANNVIVEIIDLKDRQLFSKKPHLSDPLLESIGQSLRAGQQSLIFLNRRGTARTVLCEKCGWMATCGHCDLPLTYHGDAHNLRCHTCGLVAAAHTSCPECGSAEILMKSVGTKAIVDELQSAFPQASIQRFDTDNTKSERLEANYHNVRDGKVDIVVGTQIVAKGLDLPGLSTVGIITADTSLYLPDYTAQERTYQLLRQVIGRVGRGHHRPNSQTYEHKSNTSRNGQIAAASQPDRVILQTYDPQSPVILAAAETSADKSWNSFYEAELAERRQFIFPPFCYSLKLSCRRASPKSAEAAAEKTAAKLRDSSLRIIVDGPMPALHEKHGDKFQWQLVCKAKDRGELVKAIKILPANWTYDIDPSNLL